MSKENNIIRFNYLVDPTTLMSNSWITTNTDTTQNTVTPVGGYYWRTITFDFGGKAPFSGVFRIKVDENGIPDTSVFESISGDEVTSVSYNNEILHVNGGMGAMSNFSKATENTVYTETGVAGTWSYVQSDYGITHYWRDVTFTITGKGSASGVFRIEVNENGVPISPYNYESISGDEITYINYLGGTDSLSFVAGLNDAGGSFENFAVATENTDYDNGHGTVSSYTSSTTTETVYDHYEVELYVSSDVTTFPNNLFYEDSNITSIEFDTYSITSIEDGVNKSSGALYNCANLTSIILPDNIEYIGDYAIICPITSIILPETLDEIGEAGIYVDNLSITSLAIVPPILNTSSIGSSILLTVHETALQSYINSDWANNTGLIYTIEISTYGNVLKFNYSEDPTEMLKNMWVISCTDTSANTIVGVGEHTEEVTVTHYWRTITFDFEGKGTFAGVFKIEVDEDGVPVEPFNFESISGDEVIGVSYQGGDKLTISGYTGGCELSNFSTAVEGQTYTESGDIPGTWSYVASTTTTIETVTVYDHYEVTLYINSALNTFETTMFADDDNITSIEFDYDVTSIIDDAFNGCENLSSVTLTSSVPPTIGEDTFSLISPDVVLYVPNDSITAYQTAGFGDYFAEIRGTSPVPPKRSGFNISGMIDTDFIIEVYKRR